MSSKLFRAVLTALLVYAPLAEALQVPPRPDGRVHDAAGLLSADTRRVIEEELERYESQSTNQIVVATFPSLDGESVETATLRIAETWRLGQKDRDNGALLAIYRDDRQVRIEVGYGLEGALTDALCSTIISREIVPAMRAGDPDRAVLRAVRAIIAATRGEYEAPEEPRLRDLDWGGLAGIAFFLIVALPVVVCLLLPFLGAVYFGLPGFFIGLALAAVLWFLRRRFPMPDYAARHTYGSGRHWGGGGFGGGGWGGGGFSGGGGGFGGGGASGRW